MSDDRDPNFVYRDPEYPLGHDVKLNPRPRSGKHAWGWLTAVLFLAVVVIAFASGFRPGQTVTHTAANDVTPPAANHMAPPPAPVPTPSFAPAPPAPAAAPLTPEPNGPAQRGNTQ
jgi:hypothetical protein